MLLRASTVKVVASDPISENINYGKRSDSIVLFPRFDLMSRLGFLVCFPNHFMFTHKIFGCLCTCHTMQVAMNRGSVTEIVSRFFVFRLLEHSSPPPPPPTENLLSHGYVHLKLFLWEFWKNWLAGGGIFFKFKPGISSSVEDSGEFLRGLSCKAVTVTMMCYWVVSEEPLNYL